ncbi:MAG: hypothetical protein JST28_02595 [Acidobacteria bacterium]|nr:hypothetical protein [Acidobacteriota bacterium]
MAYFKDLTRYEYSKLPGKRLGEQYNVGWLEEGASYPTGDVEPALVEKLLALCKWPVNRYRGWHGCHFCRENPVRIEDSDGQFCLGDGEIRVVGVDEKVAYAAPNLIYHYVVVHRYLPPVEFLNTLRAMTLRAPGEIRALESIEDFQNGLLSVETLSSLLRRIAESGKPPVSERSRAAMMDVAISIDNARGLPDIKARESMAHILSELARALRKTNP